MKTVVLRFQSSLFYFPFNRHTATITAYSRLSVEVVVLNKFTLCLKGQEKFCGTLKGGAPRCYPFWKKTYTSSHSPVAAKFILKSLSSPATKVAKALLVGHCEKSCWASSHVLFTVKWKILRKDGSFCSSFTALMQWMYQQQSKIFVTSGLLK